jgi:hypothetical protein
VEKERFNHILCGFLRLVTVEALKNRGFLCAVVPKRRSDALATTMAPSSQRSTCHNQFRSFLLSCVICEKRKEKRFCPAVHGRICPQCCGEQREVTLDCPSDCVYLRQARENERPRPMQDLDQAALFPEIEIGEHFLYEHEHLMVGLTYALAKSARADRSLVDADLISVLTSLGKSYQTLVNSGLHYDSPISNLSRQAVVAEVHRMVKEYREAEQTHMGYVRLRDSEVLHALVFLVRMAQGRTSGRPKSRAFVEFLFQQFPEKQSAVFTSQDAQTSIIVP